MMAEIVQHSTVKSRLKDRKLLDKFTALSEAPENERIHKTGELLKLLADRQSLHTEAGVCDDISYSVNRLVQGLSSSRKFARLGFSVALCQILRNFESLKAEHVLECIKEKSQNQLKGQVSKSEFTNIYLGKVFGFLTLVHSGRLFQEGKQIIQEVVKELLKLGQEKTSLQQLCMNGLIKIISQVKSKVFKKLVLPLIESRFTEGWVNCTPDTLMLLIYSNKYHKVHVEKFLEDHWLDPQLVSESNFSLIADVVKRSATVYPLVHVVNEELVQIVVEQKLNVVSFWALVVRPLFDPKAFLKSQKFLGLHYFDLLLPHLDTPEKVEGVIHPDITNVLCYFGKDKEGIGNKITYTLKKLTEFAKSSQDPGLQIAVLKSLVQRPGHFDFDRRTKSNTLSDIISNLLPEANTAFAEELMKMFYKQPSWLYEMTYNQAECEQWSAKELNILISGGNQTSSWQLDILQFLFLHSFFRVVKPSEDILHCGFPTRELTATSRKCLVDNFYSAVSKCMSQVVPGQSRATVLGNHLDMLYQLIQYRQTLLDNPDVVELHKQNQCPEEVETEWTKIMDTVQKINKKRQSSDKIGESHAFELLFLYVGLQLFTDPDGALESLQDLRICYNKSTQRRKSKAADDGPEWIEVITELLLSMTFKGHALSKNVAKLVLTALADHITPQAFQLILDVLQQKSIDEGPLSLEEEGEDEDEDEEEMDAEENDIDSGPKENNISEEDSDLDDDSDDGDDDDENEEEAESDIEEEANVSIEDNLKKKIKSALGAAAVESDDDSDEEESDLSDNEMFRLDGMLAQAFKGMQKEKKKDDQKQRKILNDFKMRVLDLIAAIVNNHPKCALVKEMIFPLLDLMEAGKRKEEQKELGDKAKRVFDKLYSVKKIIPDSSVDRDELLDMVKKLIQFSQKVSSDDVVIEVAKASLLVIRILLNIKDATGPSPLKTRSGAKVAAAEKTTAFKDHDYYQEQVVQLIETALHKFLHKTEGKQPPVFCHTILNRYPLMFWSLSDELLSAVGNLDVKVYQRTQACGMLASLINKQLIGEIGEDSWKDFLEVLQEESSKILSSLTQETYKAQFMKELLTVYGKLASISTQDCKMVLGEKGLEKLDSLKTAFSTDMLRLFKKVRKPLRVKVDSTGDGKKKKKNRKRKPSMNEDGKDDDDTTDNSSPVKQTKSDSNSPVETDNNGEENQSDRNQEDFNEDLDKEMKDSFMEDKSKSEKKHKKKKSSKSMDSSLSVLNGSDGSEPSYFELDEGKQENKTADKIVTFESKSLNGVDSEDKGNRNVDSVGMTTPPMSNKKNKKRKSSRVGDSTAAVMELQDATEASSPKEKKGPDVESDSTDKSLMSGSEALTQSAKKKKQKKQKNDVNSSDTDPVSKQENMLNESTAKANKEINGASGSDSENQSTSSKEKKPNKNDSRLSTSKIKPKKIDKFSPRYTRSMKKL